MAGGLIAPSAETNSNRETRMNSNRKITTTIALAGLAALAACGQSEAESPRAAETAATAPAAAGGTDAAARLAAATDESWINLSGTVVSTEPSSFVLDYGDDTITVEMDDWDWYREGRALAVGDPVVVRGRVDDGLWLNKRIEASSVYAKNLNTHFYASAADEEDVASASLYLAAVPTDVNATGYVSAIEGQELTLGSPAAPIRVDLSRLAADSRPDVKVGDRIYVWGDLDIEPRERSELMAKGMVKLAKDAGKAA